jgi:hypothetical protein
MQGGCSVKRTDTLADELERRGIAGPAAILLDAHRPLVPLIRQGVVFLGPLLSPLLGPRRFDLLRQTLDDPAIYDGLTDRLAGERSVDQR